jgi:hypothetical protein
MAYSKVPERTTSDTNSPNDINQLQDNATAVTTSSWVFKLDNAPAGSTLSFDIDKNGVSIFGATTVDFAIGESTASIIQTTSWAKFDVLSWNVDAIGSATAGGEWAMVAGV